MPRSEFIAENLPAWCTATSTSNVLLQLHSVGSSNLDSDDG